jgi:hypothetical protein
MFFMTTWNTAGIQWSDYSFDKDGGMAVFAVLGCGE